MPFNVDLSYSKVRDWTDDKALAIKVRADRMDDQDDDMVAALTFLNQNKQPLDATLTALAALTTAANKLVYATGSDAFATTDLTAFARTLLDDADALTARVTLGLVIGTDVQAYDAELAALAGLTSAADRLPYFTGSGTAALATFTAFGRSLVDDANAAAGLTTLGVTAFAQTLLDDADALTARATLGLVIGTNVQAYDAELAALAGLTSAADALPYFTGSGTAGTTTLTSFARTLLDDANQAAARTTLGLTPGTDVQAYDAELAAIAGLTSAADRLPYFTGSGTAALATFTAFARTLLDDVDAATAAATLSVLALSGGTLTGQLVLSDAALTSDLAAGFRILPVVTLDAAGDILATYAGKMVRHTSASAHAYTIQPNATIAHRIGAAITLRNIGSGAVTITRGAGVALRLSGSTTDENKVLNQYGLVTIVQEATDVWVVSGQL